MFLIYFTTFMSKITPEIIVFETSNLHMYINNMNNI